MKTLRRDISYNLACNILEANHYGIVKTKPCKDWIVFYDKNNRAVARYNEEKGKLQVITN